CSLLASNIFGRGFNSRRLHQYPLSRSFGFAQDFGSGLPLRSRPLSASSSTPAASTTSLVSRRSSVVVFSRHPSFFFVPVLGTMLSLAMYERDSGCADHRPQNAEGLCGVASRRQGL